MKFFYFLKSIFYSIKEHKFQTVFSILSIGAAISSVVLIVCAIEGSGYFAKELIRKIGSNVVFIVPGTPRTSIRKVI